MIYNHGKVVKNEAKRILADWARSGGGQLYHGDRRKKRISVGCETFPICFFIPDYSRAASHWKEAIAMCPIVYSYQSMPYSNYFIACLDKRMCVRVCVCHWSLSSFSLRQPLHSLNWATDGRHPLCMFQQDHDLGCEKIYIYIFSLTYSGLVCLMTNANMMWAYIRNTSGKK